MWHAASAYTISRKYHQKAKKQSAGEARQWRRQNGGVIKRIMAAASASNQCNSGIENRHGENGVMA